MQLPTTTAFLLGVPLNLFEGAGLIIICRRAVSLSRTVLENDGELVTKLLQTLESVPLHLLLN